jgi:hypothetical protein
LPLIDEDGYSIQKKIAPKTIAPKTTVESNTTYARKTDEHGLTLDDYIDNLNMEENIDTVKVYFER